MIVLEGQTKEQLPLQLPLRLEPVEEALEQPIARENFTDETDSTQSDTTVFYPLYE